MAQRRWSTPEAMTSILPEFSPTSRPSLPAGAPWDGVGVDNLVGRPSAHEVLDAASGREMAETSNSYACIRRCRPWPAFMRIRWRTVTGVADPTI